MCSVLHSLTAVEWPPSHEHGNGEVTSRATTDLEFVKVSLCPFGNHLWCESWLDSVHLSGCCKQNVSEPNGIRSWAVPRCSLLFFAGIGPNGCTSIIKKPTSTTFVVIGLIGNHPTVSHHSPQTIIGHPGHPNGSKYPSGRPPRPAHTRARVPVPSAQTIQSPHLVCNRREPEPEGSVWKQFYAHIPDCYIQGRRGRVRLLAQW